MGEVNLFIGSFVSFFYIYFLGRFFYNKFCLKDMWFLWEVNF